MAIVRRGTQSCVHCHGRGRTHVWSKDCGGVEIFCRCRGGSRDVHWNPVLPALSIIAYAAFMAYLFG